MNILINIVGFIFVYILLFFATGFLFQNQFKSIIDGLVVGLPLLGTIPAFIASRKGRNFFLWWFYGYAIFIVAIIHAIVLKPSEKALLKDGMVKCSSCAELIKAEAKICRYCGREVM